jgi:signal transduction histidine kinase/CheY-like chemotaxis protein
MSIEGEQFPERAREMIAKLERDHEAERQRLYALFDEAPVYMSLLEGPDLVVTLINRRIREQLLGVAMLGKRARELYREGNPILDVLERVYRTGEPETVRAMPVYFADGAYSNQYFTRTYVPLRDANGGVRGILTLGYEVTEEVRARLAREESELRSQAELEQVFRLLDEAPVGLAVVEPPDWRITMANRLTRARFGQGAVGVSLRELLPPDHEVLRAIDLVYETGASVNNEVASEARGFVGRIFNTTVVAVREHAEITGVMLASVDVTDQRRARQALESQARDLELARHEAVEAGRAKDQFLAMLGHELRNPLAPMLTALQVMRLEGAASAALDILENQTRHLTRLVDDLLDISRITRGKVTLRRQDLEIVNVVNRALEMTSPLLEQRGHRILTDVVLRGLEVSGDPDRLAQVLANLITNAAKYSEPGSQIRIVAERLADRVRLSVADDGVGISPDMLGSVFHAFVQQPQTLARSQGGLGLGLSIVKALVEAHEGTVSVHSEIGRGSRFVVELPALIRPTNADVSVPVKRVLSADVKMVRVLVVDDNEEAADILKIALEAVGHSIAIAYDGPSALEIAKTYAPQVALVDIGLPVMDGYRLAELLRSTYDIPIVAVTGYGQVADRERSLSAGFAAHLVKPVDLGELAELVSRLSR